MYTILSVATALEEVVTSRFSEELVRKVDQAVSRGNFKSRSEALRIIISWTFFIYSFCAPLFFTYSFILAKFFIAKPNKLPKIKVIIDIGIKLIG